MTTVQALSRRKYRPLDVRSWFEGFLRLIGWILVIVIAVLTGGGWIVYELMVLNRHDVDFRDMYFDQRITNDANFRYHKNFLLADGCCNPDPVRFPSSCDESSPDLYYDGPPYCKPLIMLECPDIRSAACNATRDVLYESVGLSIYGQYDDCLRAGRVRVGAQSVAAGRPITLVAYYRLQPTGGSLVIQSPFNINSTQVREFAVAVEAAVDATEVAYVQPSSRLSASIRLEEQQVAASLEVEHGDMRGIRAPPPYKSISNLWPWPGMNARCKNTAISFAYLLKGDVDIVIPRFSLSRPDEALVRLAVANSSVLVAAWRVAGVDSAREEVGGSDEVQVSYLTGVTVAVGQVPLLGACAGWQLSADPNDYSYTYATYWTGKLSELKGGTTFGPFSQTVSVVVKDIGAPRLISLFFYGGMWYIFNAFGMTAIWMFSNGIILFVIILVWWNIRSNRGLPPITYRYMQKYRGW